MLAHHLTYIVVYIVFLLFEEIAHYASTIRKIFTWKCKNSSNYKDSLMDVERVRNSAMQIDFAQKKIQKGGAWIISEGEVVLIHTIVSK